MKTNFESKGKHRRETQSEILLRDIFAEDFDITEHSGRDIKLLQREVRLAYWRRRWGRVFLAAAALLIVGMLTHLFSWKETVRDLATGNRSLITTEKAPVAASQTRVVGPTDEQETEKMYLTDEELLGLFPRGSCVLVEFNDKQVLVFKDAGLAETYLR